MCPWSDTANARDDAGHLLNRSSLAEFLKTTKLRYLKVGILYLAVTVEEDFYLAVSFKSGYGVNTNLFHLHTPLTLMEPFSLQH